MSVGSASNNRPMSPTQVQSTTPTARKPELDETPQEVRARAPIGETRNAAADTIVAGTHNTSGTYGNVGQVLPPPQPVDAPATAGYQTNLNAYSANLTTALSAADATGTTGTGGTTGATPADGTANNDQLATDVLFAAFLKLNVMDETNDRSSQQDLEQAASLLRQQAIANAKAELAQAKKNLEEAEKENAQMNGCSKVLQSLNPVYALCKAGGASEDTLGYVDPIASGMDGMAANKDEIELAKAEVDAATKALDAATNTIDWKKIAQLQEEVAAHNRAETASAGEDGVPQKSIAKLKGAIGGAVNALLKIGREQGFDAMMAAAPNAFKEAVLPILKDAGVKDPETMAAVIATEATLRLAIKAQGSEPNENMGTLTMVLGEKLATGAGSAALHASTTISGAAARQAALETLRAYTNQVGVASDTQQRNQG
ncbi:MAG: hypothetical protein HY903_24725 [Deltaproteobacteria bacterium]|nr:hypothetical protein [Deltaproteobacteria bacterium]